MLADLHLRSFRGFFLSSLGPRFLALFYERLIATGELALVAHLDAKMVGFAAGSARPSGFFARLLRRDVHRFALASLPALAKNPRIAPRLLRALRRPSEERRRPPDTATLLSICVDEDARGGGAAKALLDAFVDAARGCGARALDLTTDRDNNERVNRFYVRNGFSLGREFVTPEGRRMNEYVLRL